MNLARSLVAGIALSGGMGLALVSAREPDPPQQQLRAALQAAESGAFDPARYAALSAQPAYPWIEYADLLHGIADVDAARAQGFLDKYAGTPVADAFRGQWLAELARRQDWAGFLAFWQPRNGVALRCNELQARQATGKADAQWTADAQALWRNGKPLPTACLQVFAALDAAGGLAPELRWQRFDLAVAEAQPAVMRSAAQGLPPADAALAADYAAFVDAPDARALAWPKTERSRQVALAGLLKLAEKDPDAAEALSAQLAGPLGLDDGARGELRYRIALWSAASYLPDSARRLAAVPDARYDDRLREWRAREAMARGDWPAALAAIRGMSAAQLSDPRWQYFEARLLEKTGDAAAARPLYAAAAKTPTFHGFLAADRLDQPYALCPWEPREDRKAKAAVASDPGLLRAVELWDLGRANWATLEWDAAVARFDDTQRRLAVEVAADNGWYDRAVFGLGKLPDETRLYALRFPLEHEREIDRAASKNDLDPAWIAGEIRAESVFDPNAKSAADARGLMQLLPATGQAVAGKLGLPWRGDGDLYDADTNIVLGSAHLRELLDRYGAPYAAIAAYNAGPTATGRWLSQRPGFDPDFWIETITYKETRDYVARVLAFSVIYDWRMRGKALPLGDRLLGKFDGKRKAFACPTPP
jgi:soluble lytic murein transglycosylase